MHIVPTPQAAEAMLTAMPPGPFVMLNLYRIREVADYSANPELAPPAPISGRELFERYAAGMESVLAKVGAERVFVADAGGCFIGPPEERWDVIQFVRYPSLEAFIAVMSSEQVQADLPHRFAMLEDSRVIPMAERPLT
ncbi:MULTISPECIES: hypothetical protein [Mycobacterium ulcerans group]|uniref:DUF1330 domain-containing protein n=2 Tax=Mycobacterium ulcerans group TaxID=2993898 RepID=L7V5G7_MYCL1|nr:MULTISPECIES: hypothetical protein [Mycobacterium ulcerans group]ULL09244.1 hypothetical protein CKW46_05310 [Mycobacterium liflandii]AGC60679.1 hypothetical protein MULP_00590 [Mycobacterium liflandii 128FXT]MDC8971478.1 hypothetical protein [Mycobacterium marinum]MDC8993695.1 hypothetical protein [Mycobacterium marinum]MDC9004523.1 hypothetical protein [Mycobacterium marinum]